jgi:SOS-response transcriptional repressor LexA
VHKHLKALVRKEYLSKVDFRSRSLRVLKSGRLDRRMTGPLPVLRLPGAGDRSGAQQGPEDAHYGTEVPAALAPYPDEAYLLAVSGDGWKAYGLRDGDHLLVMPHHPVRAGVPVVASIEAGETLLGRFFRDGETITLAGLLDGIPARTFPASTVRILGVIAGTWRAFLELGAAVA